MNSNADNTDDADFRRFVKESASICSICVNLLNLRQSALLFLKHIPASEIIATAGQFRHRFLDGFG
jgi:hypothetical protein